MPPAVTSATPTKSRGAVLLGKVDATQDEIAKKCGTSRQAVQKWLSGASRPGAPQRKKLLRFFKVPVASWDEATVAKVAQRLAATAPAAEQLEDADALDKALDELDGQPTGDPESTTALAEQLGAWCRRALAYLRTADVDGKAATVADKLGRTIERVAKLRGELDVVNVLKLPQWKAIERGLETALQGHPEAARAVEAAFRRLDSN